MRRINMGMGRSMKNNPIVEEKISIGNEFLTAKGDFYSPGNILYDRYNGNYHIHKSGHICAGSHNAMVMQPSRFLLELPKRKRTRDRLLNLLNTLRGNNGNF